MVGSDIRVIDPELANPFCEVGADAFRHARRHCVSLGGTKLLRNREFFEIKGLGLVLRERIELSTSPLPMECSTTELPQQVRQPGRSRLL